jgi:chromosomal replication initiator protein
VTQEFWNFCLVRLQGELPPQQFSTWIKALRAADVQEGDAPSVRIVAPNRFVLQWVRERYVRRIGELGQEFYGAPVDLALSLPANGEAPRPARPARPSASTSAASSPVLPVSAAAVPESVEVGTPVVESAPVKRESRSPKAVASPKGNGAAYEKTRLNAAFTFDTLVTGRANDLGRAAAMQVADNPGVSYNPLFVYGGVGLGKTHLMHAIARRARECDPNRRVIYLSAEQFMHRFIRALRQQDTLSFKEQFRSVDVLMVDDIQFISGKDSTQEEFFHTFNALVDQGSQIVLSADKSPNDLENIGARLRSRMASGLVADIHPTTYELRLGILESKADQLGTSVPQKVLEFIAHKITTNGREVEGALIRLVAHAQLVGRELNLETTQEVLHDLLRAHDKRVTVDEIQKKVAEHFKIRLADMHSARRSRSVARPRQVAMYLCKQLTSRSLPEIGKGFGGRDHTTVMHAVRKVEELIGADATFAEDIELLRRMLEG